MSDWNKIFSSGFYKPRPTTYLIIKGIYIIDLANHATLSVLQKLYNEWNPCNFNFKKLWLVLFFF